jgi:hypothetical protein
LLGKARAVRVTLADMKPQWQQDLMYTDASLAAVDAVDLELNGQNLEAGESYARAADLNQKVASVSQRGDVTERTIQFDEWAAAAFTTAGVLDKARNQIQQAIDVAKNYRSITGDAEMAPVVARLQGLLQAVQK